MDRHDRAGRRHASPVVRNPILALPGTARLLQLDPHTRALLRAVLLLQLDLAADARTRAEESWRWPKPMAAYWKAVSVYAGHLARVLR
jgi:hypothetical protein